MARRTSGKPEDQEQSAAPQAGADGTDSAQQAPAATPQAATQPAGDGGDSPPAPSQEEPGAAPETPPEDTAAQAQVGASNQDLTLKTAQADPAVPHDDRGSGSEESELRATFIVTDRTDVLHNGKWYRTDDPIELNEADAEALFNNGCIKRPKDDAK